MYLSQIHSKLPVHYTSRWEFVRVIRVRKTYWSSFNYLPSSSVTTYVILIYFPLGGRLSYFVLYCSVNLNQQYITLCRLRSDLRLLLTTFFFCLNLENILLTIFLKIYLKVSGHFSTATIFRRYLLLKLMKNYLVLTFLVFQNWQEWGQWNLGLTQFSQKQY